MGFCAEGKDAEVLADWGEAVPDPEEAWGVAVAGVAAAWGPGAAGVAVAGVAVPGTVAPGESEGIIADWENTSSGKKQTRMIKRPFENVTQPSV